MLFDCILLEGYRPLYSASFMFKNAEELERVDSEWYKDLPFEETEVFSGKI